MPPGILFTQKERKAEMVVALTDEAIAEKLRLLKHYSQEFDVCETVWKATGGKRAAFKAMIDAESNYVELFDCLYRQGIIIDWDRKQQEYIVRVLLRIQ
jgi:hypothetical protein